MRAGRGVRAGELGVGQGWRGAGGGDGLTGEPSAASRKLGEELRRGRRTRPMGREGADVGRGRRGCARRDVRHRRRHGLHVHRGGCERSGGHSHRAGTRRR